uniref:Uncharacterized protein n=1 Tax=Trichuris muris TaxID=70415 RepID=A0A5S6QMF1_TRIMR
MLPGEHLLEEIQKPYFCDPIKGLSEYHHASYAMEFFKTLLHFVALTITFLPIAKGKAYDVEVVVKVKTGEKESKEEHTQPLQPNAGLAYHAEHPCPAECILMSTIQTICPPHCIQAQALQDRHEVIAPAGIPANQATDGTKITNHKEPATDGTKITNHKEPESVDLTCYKKYLTKELKKQRLSLEEAMEKCMKRCNTTSR